MQNLVVPELYSGLQVFPNMILFTRSKDRIVTGVVDSAKKIRKNVFNEQTGGGCDRRTFLAAELKLMWYAPTSD